MTHIAPLLLLLLPSLALADTTWVAPGNVQGIWSPEHSPYLIQGDVQVAPGHILQMLPGTELNFAGPFALTVFGTLQAEGMLNDSILFTRPGGDTLHGWNGLHLTATASAILEYCVFEWINATPSSGISVSNNQMFRDCAIRRNGAPAVHILSARVVTFVNCSFQHNGAPGHGFPGAAIWVGDTATVRLYDCYLGYNGAIDGGAIDLDHGGELEMDRCVFQNNHAWIWGGAIFGNDVRVTATRCTFIGNRAAIGSHLRLVGDSHLTLNSCIFAFSRDVGGAFDLPTGVPEIHHCAFFGNNPIFLHGQGPAGFNGLDFANRNGTPCDIFSNIFVDPLFADTSSELLSLLPGSPCINAADSSLAWDADGTPPDMGAQPRIDMTFVCGTVVGVWDSTGSPYIVTCDLLVPTDEQLEIRPGVRVEFAGPYTFEVRGTLRALGNETDSILFTIDTLAHPDRWEGIRLLSASDSSRFEYCRIEHAYSHHGDVFDGGGGLHALECSPTISHCWFLRNRGTRSGGGVSGYMSNLRLTDCRFTGNQAIYGGGAVFQFSRPTVQRCIFEYNVANQGGGLGYWWDAGSVINCTFVGNHGDDAGGIRISTDAAPEVTNCLFMHNTGRAAIALYENVVPGVIAYNDFFGNPAAVYSLQLPLPPDIGINTRVNLNGDSCDPYFNLLRDPLFANENTGDYRLTEASPCIDAGDPAQSRDADGTIADIGAISFLHRQFCLTIHFPGGFAGIGCPCSYPFQLPEGSPVLVRRDLTRNGRTLDDPIAGSFNITTGAGLPPWDGYWTPRPDSQLTVDSFYVEILTSLCCWLSGNLRFADSDTATVELSSWSCHESGTFGGCFDSETTLLDPRSKPADSLAAEHPDPLVAIPNPFNAVTELRLSLATAQYVELTIFDITGREVATLARGHCDSGVHQLRFDGTNLATGLYFANLRVGSEHTVRKLLLLK